MCKNDSFIVRAKEDWSRVELLPFHKETGYRSGFENGFLFGWFAGDNATRRFLYASRSWVFFA